jgi:hypothetical protein
LIDEFKGMSARKTPHLLKSLHRDQGGQWLALALDDEFVVPEGDSVQHVADSLSNVHRGYFVGHMNSRKYYSCYKCYTQPSKATNLEQAVKTERKSK